MNANLDTSYKYYEDICNICDDYSLRNQTMSHRVTALKDYAKEVAVINMVGEFEKIVFQHLGLALDEALVLVRSQYQSHQPFYVLRDSLVRKRVEVDKLDRFKQFLIQHQSLKDNLEAVINYRNYLAHGKRNGSPSNLTINQIKRILEDVIQLL